MRTLTRNHVVDSVDYVKSKKKLPNPLFLCPRFLSQSQAFDVSWLQCHIFVKRGTWPKTAMGEKSAVVHLNGVQAIWRVAFTGPSKHLSFFVASIFSISNDFNLYIDSSINPLDVWGGILSHKTKHMAYIFIMLTVGVIIINVQSFRWTMC